MLEAQLVVLSANVWSATSLGIFLACGRPYQEFPKRDEPAFREIWVRWKCCIDSVWSIFRYMPQESAGVGKKGCGMRKFMF